MILQGELSMIIIDAHQTDNIIHGISSNISFVDKIKSKRLFDFLAFHLSQKSQQTHYS